MNYMTRKQSTRAKRDKISYRRKEKITISKRNDISFNKKKNFTTLRVYDDKYHINVKYEMITNPSNTHKISIIDKIQ